MKSILLALCFVSSAIGLSISRVQKEIAVSIENNFVKESDARSTWDKVNQDDILTINSKSHMLEHLYDGDIKLSPFRNAQGRKWPKDSDGLIIIPVEYRDTYFTALGESIIDSGFEVLEKHTCARFINRTTETKYVEVIFGLGCWSQLGYDGEGRQTLSLGSFFSNCVTRGTVTHEFMHVLGFLHEHSRSDRDNYIRVIAENVRYLNDINLVSEENTTNLVTYDYGSIMQYGKFTSDSKAIFLPTFEILPRQKPEPSIGQRRQISPYDIEEIKYYYECEQGTYERCGRDFTNQTNGVFQSPHHPNYYPAEAHCTWNITVQIGQYVEVTFSNFTLENSTLCQMDAVIIHDGPNAGSPFLRKICGSQGDFSITSTGNNMFIMFTSSINDSFAGFSASFREVSVQGTPAPIVELEPPVPNIANFVETFHCDFDTDFCGMEQDSLDYLDFKLNRGETETNGTGPSYDHTSKEGQYIFIDTKESKFGESAIIYSPWFKSGNKICVKFSYHMYGRFMGGLRLYAYEKISSRTIGNHSVQWEKLGDQGNEWHTEKVTYTPASNVEYMQFYWEAYADIQTTDVAMDDVEITQGDCDLVTVYKTRSCDFESDLCGFVQPDNDQFDWTRTSGSTPSSDTGPSQDRTSVNGHYVFIESSLPRKEGDVAQLESPELTYEEHCFSMWYHMNGEDIRQIKVYKEINGTKYAVRTIRGRKGNEWRRTQVNINTNIPKRRGSKQPAKNTMEQKNEKMSPEIEYVNGTDGVELRSTMWIKVVIEATVGDGSKGDIAVDDIEITDEKCRKPISTLTGFTCNFQTNLCRMRQARDDQFDWIRSRGTTRTGGTGPSRDFTEKNDNGYYIYIEASTPRKENDAARLAIPGLMPGSYCLQFAYHMFGTAVGQLTVLTSEGSEKQPSVLWMKQGSQGNRWHQTSIEYTSVNNNESLRFFFEGVVGSSSSGDIALDDITVTNGSCPSIPTTITTTTSSSTTGNVPTPSSAPVRPPPSGPELWSGMPLCTFENKSPSDNLEGSSVTATPGDLGSYIFPATTRNDELCGWFNMRDDNFDWTRLRGSTPSSETGPTADNTNGRGFYMYIESSSPRRPNQRAFLQTYFMPASDYCFDMNYHMYGVNTGRLLVRTVRRLLNGTRLRTVLLRIRRDQGNRWNNAKIDFTSRAYDESVAFRLEGFVGSGSKGDIAVDDITILPGRCDACNDPTHRTSSSARQTFAAGCVNTELFYARCCSSSQPKVIHRRVRNCNANMFTPTQLNNFCQN